MGLLELIVVLGLVGFLTYIVVTCIPMPESFKKAIPVIVLILVVLYLVRIFGFADIPIGRVH